MSARALFSSSLLTLALSPGVALAQREELGASARVRADSPVGSTSLSSEQAQARPGVLGEPVRALLDAPGAARSGFLGSELILWGAAPNETRTYVDGVEIPYLFHPSGLRTTVHPVLIDRVSLSPGALPAEYGRGLGGAADVETRRVLPGARGGVRADAVDSSVSAEGGSQRVRALVGLRYGYFDRVLAGLAARSEGILAVPSHRDGVARLELAAGSDTQLSATWLGARDALDLRSDAGRQTRLNDFQVGSLRLGRRYDDGARVRITPFFGFSHSREASRSLGVPLSLSRRGVSYGLRADYVRSWSILTLRLGLDARGTRDHLSRQGTLSLPAREGDIRVFGQSPIDELDRDHYRVSQLNIAPWAALALRWGAFTLGPSLRLETYTQSVDRMLPTVPGALALGHDSLFVYLEPRLTVSYVAASWLRLEARAGLYHQAPSPTDLSATFGTPTLAPSRALHASLGASVSLPQSFTLELVAFERSLRALAMRTSDSPPRVAHELVSSGRGSAHGLSFSLRRELSPTLFCSASYTLSRSERGDLNGHSRLFDYDQTHVLSSVVGFTRAGFVASARLRAASGMPRTAVVGTYLDSKTGLVQPLFGPQNGVRLPPYVALDLHAEYGWSWHLTRVSLFFDLLNASDRSNVEDFAYTANYASRRNVTSIPIVAQVGANLRFGDE